MSIEWLGFKLIEKLIVINNAKKRAEYANKTEDFDYKICQGLVACINEIAHYLQTEYECDPEDIDMEDYV
ncbi:MAG: hypothetical protein Q8P20_01075 [bacterium]|nr:hypothetical protein [bacterium]